MEKKRSQLTKEQAYTRLAGVCARGERTPFDMHLKMMLWGFSAAEAEAVVNKLREQGFIDEYRYARAFVHDKHEFDRWGKLKIAAHLRAKQIPEDAIVQALEMIDTSGDVETLVSLMRKRAGTLKSKEPRLARASLMRFAAARGYSMDQAMAALERIGSNYMDAELD